jgi:hypothetical protein
MTNKIANLAHVTIALNMMGVTYADFCDRVDLTVQDLAAQSGYSVQTLRYWIDYSEGLVNEHGEDLTDA